jgi:hypothetical protein
MRKWPKGPKKGKKGGGPPRLWLETPKLRFLTKKMAGFTGVFCLVPGFGGFEGVYKTGKMAHFQPRL